MEEKMNERIQEFILQATVTTDVYNPDTGITHYRDFFDHEKFAELIVKETMRVVANQLPSNQYLDVADAVIEHYKD
jgi:hypothetical protein